MYISTAESEEKVCQNNAELWEFCQTWLVVSERRLQSSPIFPATHPTNQNLIQLPSQTKRWLNWKIQLTSFQGDTQLLRGLHSSLIQHTKTWSEPPFHPGKRYMTYAFRSEAVSHDFAVFILIIAQLEVAALPESNTERGLPFPYVRIIQEYQFFERVW